MPKVAKELSALEVKRLKHPGTSELPRSHPVGGVAGLYLQCTTNGGRTWLLKVSVAGRRRELGLGSYPEVTLAKAREAAALTKAKIRQGIDPVADRKQIKARAEAEAYTFRKAVDEYLPKIADKSKKHRDQWHATLHTYALPVLGDMRTQDITVSDVCKVIEPIWASKNETAVRLRGRIEMVLNWATVKGYRSGPNPARWAGNLKELLPMGPKRNRDNQPALQLDDAARWLADVRQREGMGARALEFLTLTAARSGEVRGATWDEIDAGIWTVPAGRMKGKREHRVPLSTAAIALLESLPRLNHLVFPAPRGGELSDMSISAVMRRMQEDEVKAGRPGYLDRISKRPAVPHGLRSTFRQWAAEQGYDRDMAEMALAHWLGSAVERAYQRSDMLERRRAMMEDWATFLGGSNG